MERPSQESVLSDAAYMADFRGSQAYDVWVKYVRLMEEDWIQRLTTEQADTRYVQGMIAGIRMSKLVPENVMTLGKMAQKQSS